MYLGSTLLLLLCCMIISGVSRLFKMRGWQGGFRLRQGGLTGIQNEAKMVAVHRPVQSVILFVWLKGGAGLLAGCLTPQPPWLYAPDDYYAINIIFFVFISL